MLSYTHFTLEEREILAQKLREGKSIRQIAEYLGRSPSSVSREIKRNRSKKGYHPWRAQNLAVRRRRKMRRKLRPGTKAWEYIIEKLQQFWSPEAICGRWHRDHPDEETLCVSTIYRYVKRKEFPGISRKTHLRRRGKRILPKDSNYNSIQPARIIPEWPEEIRQRLRIGDWEGDTVYGGVGKGLIVTLVDRKSRFLLTGLLKSRNADETAAVIERLLRGMPVQSLSFDNGSEFANFRQLEKALNTLVYFAEPHKPWQRGTNENTNGILRFFFPKGFDFRTLSEEELQTAADLLNTRPRKCLGWLSPYEFFSNYSVALA